MPIVERFVGGPIRARSYRAHRNDAVRRKTMTTNNDISAAGAPRLETLPLLLAPSGYQLLSLAAALGMTLLTVTATVI
jgi:hypothetical protein